MSDHWVFRCLVVASALACGCTSNETPAMTQSARLEVADAAPAEAGTTAPTSDAATSTSTSTSTETDTGAPDAAAVDAAVSDDDDGDPDAGPACFVGETGTTQATYSQMAAEDNLCAEAWLTHGCGALLGGTSLAQRNEEWAGVEANTLITATVSQLQGTSACNADRGLKIQTADVQGRAAVAQATYTLIPSAPGCGTSYRITALNEMASLRLNGAYTYGMTLTIGNWYSYQCDCVHEPPAGDVCDPGIPAALDACTIVETDGTQTLQTGPYAAPGCVMLRQNPTWWENGPNITLSASVYATIALDNRQGGAPAAMVEQVIGTALDVRDACGATADVQLQPATMPTCGTDLADLTQFYTCTDLCGVEQECREPVPDTALCSP